MLNRRSFTKLMIGGAATATLTGCSKPEINKKSKARIVVLGGGFGGATCAKYLKKFNSNLDVILVEANKIYHTCPFSNMVIAGEKKLSDIAHGYDNLSKKWGVKVYHAMAYKVDASNKNLILMDGSKIPYDKIVVSPGIDFKYNMEGYSAGDEQFSPHAYKAGAQTTLLRK